MIVVSIIGILAAIAIPRFAALIRKSAEGASKGNLGTMRSALKIYYADMTGTYPNTPLALTIGGKYLASFPKSRAPDYHSDSTALTIGNTSDDSAGWLYVQDPADSLFGSIMVNCTHTDTKQSVWTTY